MPKRKKPKISHKSPKTSKSQAKKQVKVRSLSVAITLILLGVVFIAIPLFYYFNQTIQLAFFTPKTNVVSEKNGNRAPIEISIPAVNLQLPVENTTISNSGWEIAEDAASYLSTSAKPGQRGTIILYAHNTTDRFGPIRKLTKGKTIILRTAGGKNHIYTIQNTMEVFPQQMEVFEHREETLVLYTCSGFADLKRFIVIAKPSF